MCWLGFAATLLILTSKGVGAEGTKKDTDGKQMHRTGHGLKQLESKDAYFDSTYKEFECAQGDHISTI